MNKVILIGRLTQDPELRYTPNGAAVATFRLAVDRPYSKDGEKGVDFVNIVVWNKPAESAAQYLKKGRQAAVDGRLQIRSYDDKNGDKKWVTEVIANYVEFLGGNNNDSQDVEHQGKQQYSSQNTRQGQQHQQHQQHSSQWQKPNNNPGTSQGQLYQNQNGGSAQGQTYAQYQAAQNAVNNSNGGFGTDFGMEIDFSDEDLPF